ncbi:MAG TPA: hypothetical protein VHK91_08125 [Flavisolibacter sp.]|jgi:gas vesicle protein|nr:hypothetical protein [Flavisolibacter sp.]
MTTKKQLLVLAAGIALASTVRYFGATDRGKRLNKKWRKKGKNLVDQLESLIRETRATLSDLK